MNGSVERAQRRIAARYCGDFAWGTLALSLACLGGWGTVTVLALRGELSYAGACVANLVLVYAMYSPQHEANHGNISGDRSEFRWVDDWVGRMLSVPLLLHWSGWRHVHLRHHAHTNDPRRDPDSYLAGPALLLPLKWAALELLTLASVLPGLRDPIQRRLGEAHGNRAGRRDWHVLGLLGAALAGYGAEAVWLWYLPGRLAELLMMGVFSWLPHHPYDTTDRYRNAAIVLFPGATWLLMGQNFHLLHHLFPRVPHYRLPRLYRDLRSLLEASGPRIRVPARSARWFRQVPQS